VSEVEAPTATLVRRFGALSTAAGIGAAFIGYHVLLGWVFGIVALRTPRSGVIPCMLPHEALASLFAGVALVLTRVPPERRTRATVPTMNAFAAVAAVLALLAVVEHLTGQALGVDAWLRAGGGPSMGTSSAIAFSLVAAGLLLMEPLQKAWAAEILGLGSGALALQALVSYLYAATPFPGEMPLYTSFAVLLLSVGLVCARVNEGFMTRVASNSLGGALARQLLPATLLVPIVLGWVQLLGQRRGLYGSEWGLALFAIANVVVFVSVVWWGVESLYRMDTRRRRAERELEDTAARLARSNADLEQFAYVASHDLKEPLRAISGSVQVLQTRFGAELGPDAEEFVRHTVDGANRMQTLIDDLLTYSRLTTREAPLEPTDCNAVLKDALKNLEVAIQENRAVVTSDELPVVRGDRTQLLQVFQNLVSNALKYRSQRTPRIQIGAEDKGGEWQISVRDNGIGIAPQYADRIFKIFQRLHTRKDYPGTGIGLAVCKKVIERHGGTIWVESEPEEGSTFFFTLPK
jgi:signal transduction histidine kinase